MAKTTHYPSFDVLNQADHWDPHTRKIVHSRLIREHGYRFLTLPEAEVLRVMCALLAGDNRGEIIQYVLSHIDHKLHANIGEGERLPHLPEEPALVRSGAAAMDQTALLRYQLPYHQLKPEEQRVMLLELGEGLLKPNHVWPVPQQAFFTKMLLLTLDAYYSHPTVWSEMGYGGPAYPRGYIRTGIGQLDPWEAKRET